MQNKELVSPIVVVVLAFILYGSALCSGPAVNYKITINPTDLSGYDIEMRIQDAKGIVRLAMAAHPEYDDRYFRYVENFSAESGGRKLAVTKPEEAIWQIDGVRGGLTVRYRIRPAAKEREWRQSWKPFLTPTGGMVGDLHMLMYVVGQEKHPARLTLDMPRDWKAVTGLEPTSDPRAFTATVEHMLDGPVVVGKFDEWKFDAGGVPHTIVIWSQTDAKPVDAEPIIQGIQRLAEQAIRAFGKPPYPRYAFLLENGGQAALEHATSVNVGISRELSDTIATIGHEYVHVWNLMDVRPRERVGLKYKFAEPTGVLWWSEGATIFFSDLLTRRAGVGDSRTRTQRLESLIARYLSAPGYSTLSAEQVSRGDSHPELLGNEWAGTHLQGEVLVNMLDLKIRDATDGQRSVDDVMHLLASKFDSDRGIDNTDIEKALNEICRCEMKGFFREYIYAAKQVEFDRYLAPIGMRAEIKNVPAVDPQGKPSVDLRIGPMDGAAGEFKLRVTNSNSAWARAGVRTGDKLISANGNSIADWPAFRTWLRALKVGDTALLVISRNGVEKVVEVPLKPFEIPNVRLVELENATPKQLKIRQAWANAK